MGMSQMTALTAIPADGVDPGAASRVILSTAALRFTVTSKSVGPATYQLIRRGEGGVWSLTRQFVQIQGDGQTAEIIVNEENDNLVQGEYWAVLVDAPGRADLVYLAPIGAIIDSAAFYK